MPLAPVAVQRDNNLLRWLPHDFDKDPDPVLALRLQYDGQMVWAVDELGFLTTQVAGGSGGPLSIPLAPYTIANLAAVLNAAAGYTVTLLADPGVSQLNARALLRDSRNIADSNGDHVSIYSNLNWVILEPIAFELREAQAQIPAMPAELSAPTAHADFLDRIGGLYGVPRLPAETDDAYGKRIPAEVVRPKCNNVAIAMAIQHFTGQVCTVDDVVVYQPIAPLWNSSFVLDGTQHFDGQQGPPQYGLFDVTYGYDMLAGTSDLTSFATVVSLVIEQVRAAGTHLRSLSLSGTTFADSVAGPPADQPSIAVVPALADTVSAPAEADALVVAYNSIFDGSRTWDGTWYFRAGATLQHLDGSAYP